MSAPFVELGPDARVAINGIMFGVTEGRYRINADAPDTTDSESAQSGTKSLAVGLTQMEIDLTAQRQSDVSPHAAPLNLIPERNNSVRCQVYPAGVGFDFYDIPQLVITSFNGSHNVSGSAPQSIQVSGKSNDFYITPVGI